MKVEPINSETLEEKVDAQKANRKVLSPAEREKANSVLSRLITNSESRRFSSYIITTNLVQKLSEEKGPFTVFAPNNSYFENLSIDRKKFYSDPKNISELESLLKSHILEGKYDTPELRKIISNGKETFIKTLSGTELVFSEIDGEIFVSTKNGKKIKILKADIPASNGQVFIIDGILGEG